jgi:hypothetical protein
LWGLGLAFRRLFDQDIAVNALPELRQILGLLAVFVVTFIVANGAARTAGHKD